MSFSEWKETELGLIPFEWRVEKIGEISEVMSGGTPSTKKEEYYGGEIPWITPKDLSGYTNKYIFTGERSITEEGLNNSSAKFLPKNSILFSSRAPIGYVAIAGVDLTTNQGFKNLVCDSKISDYNFMYYKMKSLKESFEHVAGGSTFKEVSAKVVKDFKIVLPPLKEQKAIADILSSLDDKIELNNQMNETLEEMAQALFKRWFVDFEFPNEEGQPYKSNGGEMIESELGMIPKGWKCVTLDNIISTISIKHNFNKEELIFLNTSDVLNGEVLHSNYTSVKGLPGQAKKSIQKDDILYSEIRPQNKRFAYVDFDASDYVVSTKLMVLRSKGVLHPKLIYLFLTNNKIIENLQMIAESRSGTFPQITFKELSNMKINVPLIENLNAFENSLVSLINKIFENKKENKRLIELRDSLLPKLMSGEIRVSDLEG